MRLNQISEAIMWLPGFAPEDDPIVAPETMPAVRIPLTSLQAAVDNVPPATVVIEPIAVPEPVIKAVWPRLTSDAVGAWGGKVTKFQNNVAAIKLLRDLEESGRQPEEKERFVLQRYTGWGGLPAAFNDDQSDADWVQRSAELKQILSPEEWESARNSTPNAHYTDLPYVDAIWTAVQHLGFSGGRILEPSAGVCHFIGAMPTAIAEKSSITAIELDQISGRIARSLYGHYGVQVHIQGFEKAKLPDGYFDLVISNVPFGNYKVGDSRHKPYSDFSIHNYFFGRSLDLVRAGGLIAFITSTSTMDHWDPSVRKYLSAFGEFLGAIRLPSGAFKEIANTSVTTDVIFMRKRGKAARVENQGWIEVENAPAELRKSCFSSTHMSVNKYFVSNQDMVLGKLDFVSNGYDARSVGCIYTGSDVQKDLLDAVYRLPEGVYTAKAAKSSSVVEPKRVSADEYTKPGAFVLNESRIMRSEGAVLLDIHDSLSATARSRIVGMIGIRDSARRLLAAQLNSDDDSHLRSYQLALNVAYDNFVARFGFVSVRANALAFRSDPDYPLLLSLEIYDEETDMATKAAIFTQRTVRATKIPTMAETPEEGLVYSLQEFGRVNLRYVADLIGETEEETKSKLSAAGRIYLNPETEGWETADEYLSGNVRNKLQVASLAGPDYAKNVEDLKAVQPEDLKPEEIEARLGAPWIPNDDIEAFCCEVLSIKGAKVSYAPDSAAWNVEYNDWTVRHSHECTRLFGTARADAMYLLELSLNQQIVTVKDRIDDKDVVNVRETLAAREMQSRLKEKFKDWIWSEEARRERLCRKYNDEFNSIRVRVFDGSHLTLPGYSKVVTLRKHQLDGVWRVIAGGNTLLGHAVGAGKTLLMVCASMEQRRLGISPKPLHVIPNHMLEQYTAEFLRAYPTAHVLMARKDDLAGDKRREFVARIATGDWDAVIMTHASFERIKMSPQYMEGFIQQQLADLEAAYVAARNDRGNRIVKDLARAKKTWQARLEKLQNEFKKDDVITFEELGVSSILVDEAHCFKNLFRISKMSRIAGLPTSNSERAFDMFVKTRYIMDFHDGKQRGVVFATGTPISNSMGELHTMQRFLQPQTLRSHNIENFDAWAASFGEAVTSLEVTPDGGGYRMNTRFARFINLPELLAIFGEVADIRTKEMLNLPTPAIAGGKPQTISVEASDELKEFVASLVERAESIRNGTVKPAEDNMLAVTNDGRKAALDLRLVDSLAVDHPGSKVNVCCDNVYAIWERTKAIKATQLVFCDLSTPTKDGSYSVYNDLRSKWIAKGIPESEIAFIHEHDSDAAKAKLFKQVREGVVRILLGSTQKMGMGTNVQTRLIAVHHIDCPWRPSDVEQRDGRIERQGNMNEVIEIYRYVTRGSFDAYSWQTLETKQRFITQVMSGKLGARAAEDVEMAALSYAEVKALASGNPLVLEKAGVDAELARLSLLKSQWRSNQWQVASDVKRLPLEIDHVKAIKSGVEVDTEVVRAALGKPISITVGETRFGTLEEAGKRLMAIAIDKVMLTKAAKERVTEIVGNVAGIQLGISCSPFSEFPIFYLDGQTVEYSAGERRSASGIVDVILATFHAIPSRLEEYDNRLATYERKLAGALTQVDKPFEHEEKMEELMRRQQEIDAALGLNQDNAGAMDAEEAVAMAA